MKAQDLKITFLQVAAELTQGYGTVARRPFQFREKYGTWEFSVFEDESLEPWVRDYPSEHCAGMAVVQPTKKPMTTSEAERIITRCAEAYLFMIGRRQSDLDSSAD